VTPARMSGIEACVFDAYGTLFDVHSAVTRLRAPIGGQADALSQLWRTKQLEYTWLRALMGRHADFWQVTGDALDYALARTGVDALVREPLMQAYRTLDAYPEVPHVLRRLRDAGLGTAILSNGAPEMLAAGARSAGIEQLLDAILSVEDVSIFKPHPRVYPAGGRAAWRRGRSDRLPVLQCLGRERRRKFRTARRVDQPARHAAGAPARRGRARAAGSGWTACPARAVMLPAPARSSARASSRSCRRLHAFKKEWGLPDRHSRAYPRARQMLGSSASMTESGPDG
jgi:2-haloacid dehalogenase